MKKAIVCVLRSGGVYTKEWVYRLKNSIKKHMPKDCDFVCVTDMEVPGVKTIPLVHNLPGFWSKIELFKPGNLEEYDKVLFLDLDILVLEDLNPFFEFTKEFAIAYVKPEERIKPTRVIGYQSSVMCFVPGKRASFYTTFNFGYLTSLYGDQDYLKLVSPNEDTFPKEWVLKLEPPHLTDEPPNTKICLCIRPKNHDLIKQYNWVKAIWDRPGYDRL